MVCKENVVSWFGNLSSHKRIDIMCTLLNMCLPFEVRYLGTCIEDRGKRDYNDLRDTEHHANNLAELAELAKAGGVTDTRTRRKLVLYVALLHGCNYDCATAFYKSLANFDTQEIGTLLAAGQDEQSLEELILLYTMALNHPAFTYEQKAIFGNIFLKLQEEEENRIIKHQPVVQGMEIQTGNCIMPPPIQQYGDMFRTPMVTGIPPGLSMPPPPGLLPPDQMIPQNPTPGQYLHLGFPAINSVPWTGQPMMIGSNHHHHHHHQMMYHTVTPGDMIVYPASPLVSRPSSPVHPPPPSRSPPSRSNSPNRRMRPWSAVESSTTTTTTSTSSGRSTGTTRSGATTSSTATASYSRNSLSGKNLPKKSPTSTANDTLRETLGKEMPNYKACLQNYTMEEIRRISDEELREIGLTPNAVGQLRNIVRPQSSTSNGAQTQDPKNKVEFPQTEEEVTQQQGQVSNEFYNAKVPGVPFFQDFHQSIHHHHHHHHHHHSHLANITSIRRYQTMQPGPPPPPNMDPNQQLLFHSAPPYATQNPCYACLTVPTATATSTVPNRYPRCNAQHMYCVAQLQALRLDADGSRQCSQSSSSEGSTGSRSPPGTPPVAPWSSNSLIATSTVITENSLTTTTTVTASSNSEQTPGTSLSYSTVAVSRQNTPSTIQPPPQQQQLSNERTRSMKKNQTMRLQNQIMNGVTNNSNACSVSTGGIPPPSSVNLSAQPGHCISGFPGNHPQMQFLPPGNFQATTPRLPINNTNIYSTGYSHTIYSRPTVSIAPGFQPNTPGFQSNGEIIYQYPGQPAGTPPPPPPLPPPGIVTGMIPGIPLSHLPHLEQPKISCYNCGSSSHLAGDCKEQTMEDLTKRAQYRLDFKIPKPECPTDE